MLRFNSVYHQDVHNTYYLLSLESLFSLHQLQLYITGKRVHTASEYPSKITSSLPSLTPLAQRVRIHVLQ